MELPDVKMFTLRDDVIYTSDVIYDEVPVFHKRRLTPQITQFWAQVEFDLRHIQNKFREIDFFKIYPMALDELWFQANYTASRVITRLRSYFEKLNEDHLHTEHQVRLEVTVRTRQNYPPDAVLAMTIRKKSLGPWVEKGYVFPMSMTPYWTTGLGPMRTPHRVVNNPTFVFPVDLITYFDYSLPKETDEVTTKDMMYFQPMYDAEKMIDQYLDYADYVLITLLIHEYIDWANKAHLDVIMTEDEIRQRWPYFREKIEDHLRLLFNKVAKLPDNKRAKIARYALGILLHPPDPMMLEFDPFLIFEFVEIEEPTAAIPSVAKTLEITGKIFEPHESSQNVVVSTRFH